MYPIFRSWALFFIHIYGIWQMVLSRSTYRSVLKSLSVNTPWYWSWAKNAISWKLCLLCGLLMYRLILMAILILAALNWTIPDLAQLTTCTLIIRYEANTPAYSYALYCRNAAIYTHFTLRSALTDTSSPPQSYNLQPMIPKSTSIHECFVRMVMTYKILL